MKINKSFFESIIASSGQPSMLPLVPKTTTIGVIGTALKAVPISLSKMLSGLGQWSAAQTGLSAEKGLGVAQNMENPGVAGQNANFVKRRMEAVKAAESDVTLANFITKGFINEGTSKANKISGMRPAGTTPTQTFLYNAISSTLPSLVMGTLIAVVTKNVGFGVAAAKAFGAGGVFLQQFSDKYTEYVQNGKDQEEATHLALLAGGLEGAVEYFTLGKVLTLTTPLWKKILTNFVAEGTQEFIQTANEKLFDVHVYNQKIEDEIIPILKEASYSFLIGAIVGGPMASLDSIHESRYNSLKKILSPVSEANRTLELTKRLENIYGGTHEEASLAALLAMKRVKGAVDAFAKNDIETDYTYLEDFGKQELKRMQLATQERAAAQEAQVEAERQSRIRESLTQVPSVRPSIGPLYGSRVAAGFKANPITAPTTPGPLTLKGISEEPVVAEIAQTENTPAVEPPVRQDGLDQASRAQQELEEARMEGDPAKIAVAKKKITRMVDKAFHKDQPISAPIKRILDSIISGDGLITDEEFASFVAEYPNGIVLPNGKRVRVVIPKSEDGQLLEPRVIRVVLPDGTTDFPSATTGRAMSATEAEQSVKTGTSIPLFESIQEKVESAFARRLTDEQFQGTITKEELKWAAKNKANPVVMYHNFIESSGFHQENFVGGQWQWKPDKVGGPEWNVVDQVGTKTGPSTEKTTVVQEAPQKPAKSVKKDVDVFKEVEAKATESFRKGLTPEQFIAALDPALVAEADARGIPLKELYTLTAVDAMTKPKPVPSLSKQRAGDITREEKATLGFAQTKLTAARRSVIHALGKEQLNPKPGYFEKVDGKIRLVSKNDENTIVETYTQYGTEKKPGKRIKHTEDRRLPGTNLRPANYDDLVGSYLELEPNGDVYYYEHQADGTFVKDETPVITSETPRGPVYDAQTVEDKKRKAVERKQRIEDREQAKKDAEQKRLGGDWGKKEHGDVDAIVYDEEGNADVTAWFNLEELQVVGAERAQEDAAIDEESAQDVQEVESITRVTYNKNTGFATFLNAAGEDIGDQYNFNPLTYDGLVDRNFREMMEENQGRITQDLGHSFTKADGLLTRAKADKLSQELGAVYTMVRRELRKTGITIQGFTLTRAKVAPGKRSHSFNMLVVYDAPGRPFVEPTIQALIRTTLGRLEFQPGENGDVLGNIDNVVVKPNLTYDTLERLINQYSSEESPMDDVYTKVIPYKLYQDLLLDARKNTILDTLDELEKPINVKSWRLDFIGQIADTAEKIANLFKIIRNPSNELGSLVFVSNGEIVYECVATYGLAGTTSLIPKAYAYKTLIDEVDTSGLIYDKVYMVHNHPKSPTAQSDDDKGVALTLRTLLGYRGISLDSVILDHDHASIHTIHTDADGLGTMVPLPNYSDVRVNLGNAAGVRVVGDIQLCYFMNALRKTFKNSALYLDANRRVVGVEELSDVPSIARGKRGREFARTMREKANRAGAAQVFLYLNNARKAESYFNAFVKGRLYTEAERRKIASEMIKGNKAGVTVDDILSTVVSYSRETVKGEDFYLSGVLTIGKDKDSVTPISPGQTSLYVDFSKKNQEGLVWAVYSKNDGIKRAALQDIAKIGQAEDVSDATTTALYEMETAGSEADIDRSFELEAAEKTAEEYFKDAVNPTPDSSFPIESDSTVKRWWKKFWAGAKRFDMFISSIPRLQEMTNVRLWSEFSRTYDSYLRAENAFERETAAFLKTHKLNAADDKAIYLYALQQQNERGELSAVLRKMGVDPNVKMTLTAEQLEAYNYCRKWFDELYVATQNVAKRMNDEFQHQKNYFPVVRVSDDDSHFPLKYEDTKTHDVIDKINSAGDKIHFFSQDQAKAWMLEREGGDYQTVVSAFDVLAKYVDDANYYINCGEEIHKISDLVGTNAALLKMGRTGRQVWMEWSDALARRGGMASGRIKALDSMRNNLATAIFGFKAASAFLQLGSTVDTIAGTGIENWWLGAKMAVNQDWLAFVQENAPGVYKVYEDITLSEINKGKNLFKRWAFAPLMKMDRIVRINTFLAFYTKYCNDNGVEIDFAKPNLEMIDQAMAATVRTQGSSNFKDSNIFITQGNWGGAAHIQSVTKAIMMFQNFPLTRFHNMVDKIYTHGIKSKNYKGAADGLWYLLLIAVALELLTRKVTKETLAGLLGKDADDKKFWTGFGTDMLRTAIGNLPSGGTFVGVSEGYSEWIPLFRELSDVAKGMNQATRGVTANTRTSGAIMLAKGVASIAGIPGTYQAEELSRYIRKKKIKPDFLNNY